LGIKASQCVVFEDAEAGIEAALAAQMKCVGIGSPINLGKANLVIDGLHQMSIEKLATL
jgi:beta-phosphoglucomutase